MQKQGSRMLLVGVVVVALAGAVVWNAASMARASGGGETPGHEGHDHGEGKAATKEERDSAQKTLLSRLEKRSPQVANAEGEDPDGIPDRPTILVDRPAPYRPAPNDAGTATHWYQEDSRSAKISERNERERSGG